jgi:hypothetical protein
MKPEEQMLVAEHQKCHQSCKWCGGHATIFAVVGLVVLIFSGMMFFTFTSRSKDVALNSSDPILVNMTLVKNAEEKGACKKGTRKDTCLIS